MSIVIDKEFESLIPPLSPEEFQQLEENCVKEGIRDALITWNGILVDGHNRFKIAAKHGLHWNEKRMEFADRDSAKVWIIDNQLGKRNLIPYDKTVLLLKRKEILSKTARQISNSNLKQGTAERPKLGSRGRVNKQIGDIVGMGAENVRKVEAINNSGNTELIQQVRNGEKSIHQGWTDLKEKERRQTDLSAKAHLEKAEERHKDFTESKTVNISDVAQDKKDSAEIARSRYNEIYNAIKKILFIGASNFDYSIISPKTINQDEIRRLQGELNISIEVLKRIKNEIGG